MTYERPGIAEVFEVHGELGTKYFSKLVDSADAE
jgi:hypothetical protein